MHSSTTTCGRDRDFPRFLWRRLFARNTETPSHESQPTVPRLAQLRFLRDSVAGTDLAHEIDLVAAPDDPKDLFGMVGAPVPAL